MKVKEVVVTECKSCESSNLVEVTTDVISSTDVNKLEKIEALKCSVCGTFHAFDGSWIQHNINQSSAGYSKTDDLKGVKNLN